MRGQVRRFQKVCDSVSRTVCVNFNLNMSKVKISTRGARRIRKGHIWVYRSDVREAADVEPGAIVRVIDDAGNFVGQAFYSDRSEIALRFLTTRDERINDDWWRARLRQCFERRAAIMRETNAYRLVYSEGDLLSSLIVDVYDGHFVLQTLSQGSDRIQNQLTQLLVEEFHPKSIIELNDARVRQLEGLELRSGMLYVSEPGAVATGSCDSPDGTTPNSPDATTRDIEINQHGLRFIAAPLAGQKTGAFLDQRENYLAAAKVAHGRALDCFTFNGGFALHIAASCDSVLGIDISNAAVAAAAQNAQLNGAENVTFKTANVFDALREMETAGERFDTIILDPPAFTKSRVTVKSGARGYKEINLRALKLLNPGGILITCTCSYHVSEEMFLDLIAEAALDAHRRLQIIEKLGQSTDHPVLLGVPETHYLKCVIARVME